MHKYHYLTFFKRYTLLVFLFSFSGGLAQAQLNAIVVNLTQLEGIEIKPENVFNYQVINNSGRTREAEVMGILRFRNSSLKFTYKFNTLIQAGTTYYSKDKIHDPVWSFSDNGLKELFFNYGKLPQGTYEYCVEIRLKEQNSENMFGVPVDACIYHTVNDIFLINLLEPEDDAKLYEPYPMFSWIVNYPFASALNYRIRIAELKEGQNKENAITRNNPVYQDNHVLSTNLVYPVTAKPLKKFQPYIWTVDAYYKGILLGGAEAWQFTIIEDSLLIAKAPNSSYINVRLEKGVTQLFVTGTMKLKYVLHESAADSIYLKLSNKDGKEIKLKKSTLPLVYGDNRFILNYQEDNNLVHMGSYKLTVTTKDGQTYILPFKYMNPDFIKE